MPPNKPVSDSAARLVQTGGQSTRDIVRTLPEETPVALSFNGVTHAVMLATPADLEDFGCGFALSEAIVQTTAEILDLLRIDRRHGLRRVEAAARDARARDDDLFGQRLLGARDRWTGQCGRNCRRQQAE